LYDSDVRADAGGLQSLEAELFTVAVMAAEKVRGLRRATPQSQLVCANICLRWSASDREHRSALAWPHWVLKCLYAPVGLMIGKFWRGEIDTDRHDRRIPPPPVTFLSVRSAVRPRDPRFLTEHPAQAAAIAYSHDDGRDVFAAVPGLPHDTVITNTAPTDHWATLRAWSTTLLPDPHRQPDRTYTTT
jgi:hypothetical protein